MQASDNPHLTPATPDLVFPLVIFDDVLWPADSWATLIRAVAMPEPYRRLLVHNEHMTVTVEAHFGAPVDVRVLQAEQFGDFYHRRIVLVPQGTDRVVQYGLMRIDLACCSAPVREEILARKTPLGRILIEHNVLRRVEPTSFLRIDPGPSLSEAMGLTAPVPLYGRTGVIFFNDRPAVAVLEVLAPV
jgi:chorismate-pyruvate lyase